MFFHDKISSCALYLNIYKKNLFTKTATTPLAGAIFEKVSRPVLTRRHIPETELYIPC